MASRVLLRGYRTLWVALIGLSALACGPPAKPSFDSDEPSGDARARLAAKRKELAEGTTASATGSPKSRMALSARSGDSASEGSPLSASQKLRDRLNKRSSLSKRSREEEPEPIVEEEEVQQQVPEPPAKPAFPSHLSRRERLTLACYRDDFNVKEEAHMEFLLPQEREFCSCVVDAVYSARVPASLQDVLIEDFMRNRGQVEAAVPAFKQRWRSRCPM